ncbi:YfhH family protein [Salipaludibacillus sp. HK11]|uniref:YfhH family protein n=1 Tax=Salipaludibacillus sp. HK11 TaxID=3394320 RepID=UPI0039FC257F
MDEKYSRMAMAKLQQEIAELKVKAQKAEQKGMINEFAVYERKMIMAQAYLLDPQDFKSGQKYDFKDDPQEFFDIEYMNGVFAWGYRSGSKELEGVPISILGERKN